MVKHQSGGSIICLLPKDIPFQLDHFENRAIDVGDRMSDNDPYNFRSISIYAGSDLGEGEQRNLGSWLPALVTAKRHSNNLLDSLVPTADSCICN